MASNYVAIRDYMSRIQARKEQVVSAANGIRGPRHETWKCRYFLALTTSNNGQSRTSSSDEQLIHFHHHSIFRHHQPTLHNHRRID